MCSHTLSLSVVRGLTNWFSDHLGACVWFVMVYPAQKNQNQIRSAEFLWHILPICSKASTLDLGVSLWQGLSHEYQRGKITDNCFGWKWLFFHPHCPAGQTSKCWCYFSILTNGVKAKKQTNRFIVLHYTYAQHLYIGFSKHCHCFFLIAVLTFITLFTFVSKQNKMTAHQTCKFDPKIFIFIEHKCIEKYMR